MPPLPPSLAWLDDELAGLDERGLRRRLVERGSRQGAEVTIGGRRVVNFGSNDYLGLASDPRLAEAALRSAQEEGWGAGASPLVTGRSTQHALLERRLAQFEGAAAALLFPTGFAANAGVIPTLAGAGDAIYSDAKNHASLIDGCRLSRAERFVYPHNDTQELARLLGSGGGYRRRLIVTDTLFSMDGDFAPLDRLGELAERYDAMLLVDEAHATGVWGAEGRGAVEHFAAGDAAVERRVAVRIGTLSKALGAAGGFVAGPGELIDYLANEARSYVFSTAPPAPLAAACVAALAIVREEPDRRERVRALAEWLRTRLVERGHNVGQSRSQIVPIVLGDVARTMGAARRLFERGLFVPGIRPPTVPEGESLLRVSVTAGHTQEQLMRLVDEL